jgi:hypothetical protein
VGPILPDAGANTALVSGVGHSCREAMGRQEAVMPYRDVQTHAMAHRSRVRCWALVGALALWGVLGWEVASVPALPIEYFAVGDSVASGRGLDDDETALSPVQARLSLASRRAVAGDLSGATIRPAGLLGHHNGDA